MYTLPLGDPVPAEADRPGWGLAIYRNTKRAVVTSSMRTPPYTFPSVTGAAAGSLVIGLIGGNAPSCDATPGIGSIANLYAWSFFEASVATPIDLNCSSVAGANDADLYQLVLSP